MAYAGQILDIFVSSPGDVSKYRSKIIAIVQAWNQRNGRSKSLFFNCLRWEDLVASDTGASGQDVINGQIGDNYDVFLGVMWARFGSPTLVAESGTEEEFDRAIARHRSGEPVRVSFLFCTASVPFSEIDPGQFARVKAFKEKVQACGCLTRDFCDDADLINEINRILDRVADTWNLHHPMQSKQLGTVPIDKLEDDTSAIANSVSDEDVGLFDVLDEYEETSSGFNIIVNSWGGKLAEVARHIEQATEELSQMSRFGTPERDQVRRVLGPLSEEFDKFADWCEDALVEMEPLIARMSQDTSLILDFSRQMNEGQENLITARDGFMSVISAIGETNISISHFIESLETSLKIDKKMNKANRRLVSCHSKYIEKLISLQDDLSKSVSELDDRIEMSTGASKLH